MAVSGVSQNSANADGEITSIGGSNPTTRGFCWSTTSNPTTADSKTEENSSTEFTGSTLSKNFYNQLILAMIISFILMMKILS